MHHPTHPLSPLKGKDRLRNKPFIQTPNPAHQHQALYHDYIKKNKNCRKKITVVVLSYIFVVN